MNEATSLFMFAALCQYLDDKGILDNAEFRAHCHKMMEHLAPDVRQQVEPAIAAMSIFGWSPKSVPPNS